LIAADPKSADLIKPMVRGRDTSAYGITGFEYLIGTFPALKLEIDHYPAIKNHLLAFGYDRLKQTGETARGKRQTENGLKHRTASTILKSFQNLKSYIRILLLFSRLCTMKTDFSVTIKALY